MNAKPKTELNRCVFVQKRNSVNGASIPLPHVEMTYISIDVITIKSNRLRASLRTSSNAIDPPAFQ